MTLPAFNDGFNGRIASYQPLGNAVLPSRRMLQGYPAFEPYRENAFSSKPQPVVGFLPPFPVDSSAKTPWRNYPVQTWPPIQAPQRMEQDAAEFKKQTEPDKRPNVDQAPLATEPVKASRTEQKKPSTQIQRPETPPKGSQAEEPKGVASKLMGAFKVTSALLITGSFNAFFIGVPIWATVGLSTLVASMQSLAALKIHKEDHPTSRKIVDFSRKLMGREQDHTPAGKEWSMLPVWSAVCGSLALLEVGVNHLYKVLRGDPKEKSFNDKLKVIQEAKEKGSAFAKPFYDWQIKGMNFFEQRKGQSKALFNKYIDRWLAQDGVMKLMGKVGGFLREAKGGNKMYFTYLWSVVIASLGGALQTAIAAKFQEKLDKKHGLYKNAPKKSPMMGVTGQKIS